MNAGELEKIVARHEMRCRELKESFNGECVESFIIYGQGVNDG